MILTCTLLATQAQGPEFNPQDPHKDKHSGTCLGLQPWGDRNPRIPGVHNPASLPEPASSKPVRDGSQKPKRMALKSYICGGLRFHIGAHPQAPTPTLTHFHTHTQQVDICMTASHERVLCCS